MMHLASSIVMYQCRRASIITSAHNEEEVTLNVQNLSWFFNSDLQELDIGLVCIRKTHAFVDERNVL